MHIAGIVIISLGLAFDFFGCLGLVRFPDVYNRLQAATKGVTLGTCGILIGTLFMFGNASFTIKALICAAFLFLASPTSTHALSRGAHIFGIKLWVKSAIDKYEEDKESKRKAKK